MRSDPTSELLAESSAVAVWVDLCGSTPTTIVVSGFFRSCGWESAADNPTSRASHSSLRSRLSSVTPRTQTGGDDTPYKVNPIVG